MLFNKSTMDPEAKITEADIVSPCLLLLAQAGTAGYEGLTTGQLRTLVRQVLVLSQSDQAPLAGRKDAKIDQVIRNLISHGTLTRTGFAQYQTPLNGKAQARLVLTESGRAHLMTNLLPLLGEVNPGNDDTLRVSREAAPLREEQIIMPALLVLAKLGATREDGCVQTTELRQALKTSMALAPEDVGRLKNRNDLKVDQIIRNLISHNTLSKSGWVERTQDGLKITQAGLARLLEDFLPSLPAPNFEQEIGQPGTGEFGERIEAAHARPRASRPSMAGI